jgi:micrococcal nuclease
MTFNSYLRTSRQISRLFPRSWRNAIIVLALVLFTGWFFWGYWQRTHQPIVASGAAVTAQVTKVVDGDTIDVSFNSHVQRVRLLGIDTPEVVDPKKPVECFGPEASRETHKLLDGKTVKLEPDLSQDDADQYGRLLRYVFLPDGQMVNLILIQQGYAHQYTFDRPYQYQGQFMVAEQDARQQQVGFWSPNTCNGNTYEPAPAK